MQIVKKACCTWLRMKQDMHSVRPCPRQQHGPHGNKKHTYGQGRTFIVCGETVARCLPFPWSPPSLRLHPQPALQHRTITLGKGLSQYSTGFKQRKILFHWQYNFTRHCYDNFKSFEIKYVIIYRPWLIMSLQLWGVIYRLISAFPSVGGSSL